MRPLRRTAVSEDARILHSLKKWLFLHRVVTRMDTSHWIHGVTTNYETLRSQTSVVPGYLNTSYWDLMTNYKGMYGPVLHSRWAELSTAGVPFFHILPHNT